MAVAAALPTRRRRAAAGALLFLSLASRFRRSGPFSFFPWRAAFGVAGGAAARRLLARRQRRRRGTDTRARRRCCSKGNGGGRRGGGRGREGVKAPGGGGRELWERWPASPAGARTPLTLGRGGEGDHPMGRLVVTRPSGAGQCALLDLLVG